jgi:hypothetical protein
VCVCFHVSTLGGAVCRRGPHRVYLHADVGASRLHRIISRTRGVRWIALRYWGRGLDPQGLFGGTGAGVSVTLECGDQTWLGSAVMLQRARVGLFHNNRLGPCVNSLAVATGIVARQRRGSIGTHTYTHRRFVPPTADACTSESLGCAYVMRLLRPLLLMCCSDVPTSIIAFTAVHGYGHTPNNIHPTRLYAATLPHVYRILHTERIQNTFHVCITLP